MIIPIVFIPYSLKEFLLFTNTVKHYNYNTCCNFKIGVVTKIKTKNDQFINKLDIVGFDDLIPAFKISL